MVERIFATRTFVRWMRTTRLEPPSLLQAIREAASGLIDADLGGGLLKKRVALGGRGKRGGARVIVAHKTSGHWFLLVGFTKNQRDALTQPEMNALEKVASDYLQLNDAQLAKAVQRGLLQEITHGVPETQPHTP